MKNFSDIVKCYGCGKTSRRRDSLILQTPKGKFRICRDCYAAYEESKHSEAVQEVKSNIKLYNLSDIDEVEVITKREQFIKDIKGGKYG